MVPPKKLSARTWLNCIFCCAMPFFTLLLVFTSVNWCWPFRLFGAYEAYTMGRIFYGSSISISPDGASIIAASPRTGHGDVYSVGIHSKSIKRLTNDPNYEGNPSISPNGRMIAFERENRNCGHIWLMDADGSHPRQLTFGTGSDSNPSFSPDGKHVWFSRNYQGNRGLYRYQVDLDGASLMATNDSKLHLAYTPSFPTTGSPLYCDIGGGDIVRVSDDWKIAVPVAHGWSPSVSHDGSQIVFLKSATELAVMRYDGKFIRSIYCSAKYIVEHPVFSQDDKGVYFVEQSTGDSGNSMRYLHIAYTKISGSGYRVVAEL